MPIFGMSDRGMGFPIIGKVKKGKKLDNQPIDLDYFRVIIDETETKSQELFLEAYGEHPRELNIFLPFHEIDRVWDAWLKAFTFSRQIAISDGKYMQYLIDTNTGKKSIVNGKHVETGEIVPHMEIPGYTKNGKALEWKASGSLKMIVPELKRACYLILYTTSVWDIIQLSDELRGIDYFTKGRLAGTKLLLKRRKQKVSCPKGNNPNERMLLDKWLCHIEIHPENVDANIRAYQALAMPAIELPPQLETGVILEGNDDEEDITPEDFIPDSEEGGPPNFDEEEEINPEDFIPFDPHKFDVELYPEEDGYDEWREVVTEELGGQVTEAEDEPEEDEGDPEQPAPAERPYKPEELLERFTYLANHKFKEDICKELTAEEKSQLRLGLRMCFMGEDQADQNENSKTVLEYLTGARTTANKILDRAMFRAIAKTWLKMKRESPDEPWYLDDDFCMDEARNIVELVKETAQDES